MHPDEPPVLRDRVHAALTTTPTTVANLASHVGASRPQTYKALRHLEDAGHATRTRVGRGGQARDYWRAAGSSTRSR